jgi:hypothetical protein
MEGADVISENNVPVGYHTLFDRIDQAIRPQKALVAVAKVRTSPMEPAAFYVFEVELRKEVDLVKRAEELGLLEPFESPIAHWTVHPRG